MKEQETFKEAAEREYPGKRGLISKDILSIIKQEAFINGAKWQQKQDKNKYSEEEVYDLIHKRDVFWTRYKNTYSQDYITTKEWFEQFKKK
jgi:hypothetical protein